MRSVAKSSPAPIRDSRSVTKASITCWESWRSRACLVRTRTPKHSASRGDLTLPLFIYEGTRGLKILEMFKKSPTRVAVVLDEYGTVEGLLTLTDILEAIVGDMPATAEDEDPPAVQQPDGSWLLDGRLPLDEFRDLFELSAIPEGDFHTLAGLVVTQLGHIPRVAESFDSLGSAFRGRRYGWQPCRSDPGQAARPRANS